MAIKEIDPKTLLGDNPAIKELLKIGVHSHQQGKIQQASDAYIRALSIDPDHPDTNHLLGVLNNQIGNPKTAILLIGKAIAQKPTVDKFHNNLGLAYKLEHRITEATASFAKAIELNPKYEMAYLNLGQMLMENQHFDEAIKQYHSALQLTSNKPGILLKIAALYVEQNVLSLALKTTEDLISTLTPHYQEELNNNIGKLESTITEVKQLFKIGLIFKRFSNHYYAAICMAKIINLDRDCTQAYLNFGNIIDTYPILIKNIAYASTIESAVSRFLARNDMRHDAMRDQINLIIDIDDATNEIESFVNTNDNDAFNFLKNSSRLLNILFRPCFLQYLQRATNVNITVEKLLTKTRKCLLNALFNLNTPDNTPITDQFSLLIAALAYQCFLNEYIFYVDPAEEAILVAFERQTKDKLEKHTSDALIYSALLVCYKQLMDSPDIAEKIMSYHALITPGLEGIIRLQISNPEKEKKIRNSIRQLKSIGNPTSQQVRQQYEENPYPRWSSAHYSTPIPIIDTIKNAIAPNKPVNLPDIKKPRILIAGCGTGRHPIDCAKAYKNSSILAIDLSLSSLSYAQRQADERGVNNIEFMQADILDLGKLNEQFDIIESCGVLHHMKEPLAGWKVLENLLKPGGLMKIGLYSELARAHIVTSRDIIAEQNFKSTPEGIRECRRFIQRMGDSDIFNSLLRSTDFFTTSMVRDLIFHSMEHRFSVPQIEDALTQLNLQFLGFCVSGDDTKKRYLQQFPADKTATSLTNWHIFEQQNPHYFQAMYQFWLRKSVM